MRKTILFWLLRLCLACLDLCLRSYDSNKSNLTKVEEIIFLSRWETSELPLMHWILDHLTFIHWVWRGYHSFFQFAEVTFSQEPITSEINFPYHILWDRDGLDKKSSAGIILKIRAWNVFICSKTLTRRWIFTVLVLKAL